MFLAHKNKKLVSHTQFSEHISVVFNIKCPLFYVLVPFKYGDIPNGVLRII